LDRYLGIGRREPGTYATHLRDQTAYEYGRGDYRSIEVTTPPTAMLPNDLADAIGADFIDNVCGGNLRVAVGHVVYVLVTRGLMADWTP
jgi:hypothetical protein